MNNTTCNNHFYGWEKPFTTVNPYSFYHQGQLFDASLGWQYYRYRNYDPMIARFHQVEPLVDKYPWLGYVFSENKVTYGVEFEGLEKVQKIKIESIGGRPTPVYVLEPITIKVKFSLWDRVAMLWNKLRNERINIRIDAGRLGFVGAFGNLVSVDLLEVEINKFHVTDFRYFGKGGKIIIEQEAQIFLQFPKLGRKKKHKNTIFQFGGYFFHRFRGWLRGHRSYDQQKVAYGMFIGPLSVQKTKYRRWWGSKKKPVSSKIETILSFAFAKFIGIKVSIFDFNKKQKASNEWESNK